MVLGSNYDASIHELLNDNPNKCKVVDLCTGTGHWYVAYPSDDKRWRLMGSYSHHDILSGYWKGVSPRRVPWA
jgi:hypothetical protein